VTKNQSIEIYQPKKGLPTVEVRFTEGTVWLNQKLMSELFDKDADTIGLHIRNIFKEGELQAEATTEDFSVVQKEGNRHVKRQLKFYNLDMIISVGYRVKSKTATQFRIWATNVLRDHLVKGYTINEKRLQAETQKYTELKKSIKLLENVLNLKSLTDEQSLGLIEVITEYSYALDVLDQFDLKELKIAHTTDKELYKITYREARKVIRGLGEKFGGNDLFGNEKDDSFKSSIGTIYQTFDGKDLYPSVEEKAAHLLYFVTKNHSFTDGNKRIAASLFIWFMSQNGILFTPAGEKRIADNALIALTLLIAESKPEEKDTVIKVIVNLINQKN